MLLNFCFRVIPPIILAIIPSINDVFINFGGKDISINNLLYLYLFFYISISVIFLKKFYVPKILLTFSFFYLYALVVGVRYCIANDIDLRLEYTIHIVIMLCILLYFSFLSKYQAYLFWKAFYSISFFLVSVVFIQFIIYKLTGVFISFVERSQEYRPAAFFSEPAHYSMLMGLVHLSLLLKLDPLYIKNGIRILISCFISISLLLSSSSSGMIYVLFVWGLWILKEKSLSLSLKLFLLVIFSLIFTSIFAFTDELSTAYEHFMSTDFSSVTSGSFRIARGFDLFSNLSVTEKLFGIGCGSIDNYIISSNFISIYDNLDTLNSNYVSVLSSFLLEGGALGTLMFIVSIAFLSYRNKFHNVSLLIMFFLLILSNEIIYTPQIYYSIGIYILIYRKRLYSNVNNLNKEFLCPLKY